MKPIWKKKERKQQMIETMKRITPDERKEKTNKNEKKQTKTQLRRLLFSV